MKTRPDRFPQKFCDQSPMSTHELCLTRVTMKPVRSEVRKSDEPQADMSALEGEIDQLVAPRQLYGLSEDEVKIVEGR